MSTPTAEDVHAIIARLGHHAHKVVHADREAKARALDLGTRLAAFIRDAQTDLRVKHDAWVTAKRAAKDEEFTTPEPTLDLTAAADVYADAITFLPSPTMDEAFPHGAAGS